MESDLTRQFLKLGYQADVEGAALLSPDGRDAYLIQPGGRGVRDLRDAAIRLATLLARHPAIKRGYVLASLIRISAGRVRAEWNLIKQVLLPKFAARMHLVAIVDGVKVLEPPKPRLTPVLDQFLAFAKGRSIPPNSRPSLAATWKHLEIEKLLLYRWLLGLEPIPIGTLIRQVGCSYPTAIQSIRKLTADGLIGRGRGRSVAFTQYPRDRWAELLRAQRLIYPPDEFVDPTAAPGSADAVLRRLNRQCPREAAIGGVVAARKWDPSFDLNGTPRIDLLLHKPVARGDYLDGWIREESELVRRLDPALKRRSPQMTGATVLVLHRTYRRDPLFLQEPQSPIPLADPVEVLFHLHEMGLTQQAGDLIRHLRQKVQS